MRTSGNPVEMAGPEGNMGDYPECDRVTLELGSGQKRQELTSFASALRTGPHNSNIAK